MTTKQLTHKTAAVRLTREAIKHATIKRDINSTPSLNGSYDIDGAFEYLKVANLIGRGYDTLTAVQKVFHGLPQEAVTKVAEAVDNVIQTKQAWFSSFLPGGTPANWTPPETQVTENRGLGLAGRGKGIGYGAGAGAGLGMLANLAVLAATKGKVNLGMGRMAGLGGLAGGYYGGTRGMQGVHDIRSKATGAGYEGLYGSLLGAGAGLTAARVGLPLAGSALGMAAGGTRGLGMGLRGGRMLGRGRAGALLTLLGLGYGGYHGIREGWGHGARGMEPKWEQRRLDLRRYLQQIQPYIGSLQLPNVTDTRKGVDVPKSKQTDTPESVNIETVSNTRKNISPEVKQLASTKRKTTPTA